MDNKETLDDVNMPDEKIDVKERLIQIENNDKREDAQRRMAWFSLIGMLLYPGLVLLSEYLDLNRASAILGDMAATYFVSVAAIVAAFFGAQAYASSKAKDKI